MVQNLTKAVISKSRTRNRPKITQKSGYKIPETKHNPKIV